MHYLNIFYGKQLNDYLNKIIRGKMDRIKGFIEGLKVTPKGKWYELRLIFKQEESSNKIIVDGICVNELKEENNDWDK